MPDLHIDTELVPCELCGGTAFRPLTINDALRVVRCCVCALVFVNPRPSTAALRQYYGAKDLMQHDAWSAYFQHSSDQLRDLWQERLRDLHRWKPGSGLRLLDVGSGYGDFLYHASSSGWDVLGFEFAPAVAEVCKQKYGIPVQVGQLSEIGLQAASFDAITMWHVLEHLPQPVSVLQRTLQLLAPGGLLALEVPNLNFLVRKSYRYPLSATLHLYHFTPATLTSMVRKVGFKVLECRQGNTGFLYRSPVKIYAKKAVYLFSHVLERLAGINAGDSIRLYAQKVP